MAPRAGPDSGRVEIIRQGRVVNVDEGICERVSAGRFRRDSGLDDGRAEPNQDRVGGGDNCVTRTLRAMSLTGTAS